MCQFCVDDGKLSQETYDRIEVFVEEWPDSAYGPGHIVLGDCNLLDGDLDWCRSLISAVLAHRKGEESCSLTDDDRQFLTKLDWYRDDKTECLEATLEFLRELRVIPEDDR